MTLKYSLKKIFALFLILNIITTTFLFTGCEEETVTVYFGVEAEPYNIDPQKAETYAELLAVRNCFRGLYKLNENNETVPDLAESVSISEDGLKYTITLTEAFWRDGTAVTADDFQFGFERAKNPATASPSGSKLDNIVSVIAVDSSTLTITLSKPDKTLPTKLTSAVFMPCNRVFFENCGGKYGLTRENILTNGNYYPSQWIENKHLKLTLSGKAEKSQPLNVFLTASSTGKDTVSRINKGEIDMTVNGTVDFTTVNTSKFTVETAYKKTYVLIFNKNSDVGKSEELTKAFAESVDRNVYTQKMSIRFELSNTVLPKNSLLLQSKADDLTVPQYGISFDSQTARKDFLNGIKSLKDGKLPQFSVLTVENKEVQSVLTDVVSQWQNHLGAYVNISTEKTEQALFSELRKGAFTAALVPFEGNIEDILSEFADKDSGIYLASKEYDEAYSLLNITDDYDTGKLQTEKCLSILASRSEIIPVFSVPTAYIYRSNLKNVVFSHIDGTVDFSIIDKKS